MPPEREPGFQAKVAEGPDTYLYAERLRDGRIALGTRVLADDGEWVAGEMHLLDPSVYLDLAAWLSPAVEEAWLETVRGRQEEPLRTAEELYGSGAAAAEQLALEMLREIPSGLLVRGLVLLINSVGPEARERLVSRLNATGSVSEDSMLRRQLADESAAVAYGVAAAALFDALASGVLQDEGEGEEG